MSRLEILYASIAALTGVLALLLPLWRARHRYGLRWAILPPRSMTDIAEEIAPDLIIEYRGRRISEVRRFQFILHNTGRTPLDQSDIVAPSLGRGQAQFCWPAFYQPTQGSI